MRVYRTAIVCCVVLAALTAAPLTAQTGNGVVQGTVLDATRAAIPAASVLLQNTATGVARSALSSTVGIYYFGSVPIGPYSLTVTAQGFKKWEGTLNVETGQTITIDPAMELGSVNSAVEVTGAAPVISTEGMQVSDVKDSLRIQQLPLNGRLITNLFFLTPGIEQQTSGVPRTNGMKVGATEMLLDGISLVARDSGGITYAQPGLDTVQEYRIETAGSGAEYSRPATVILSTRSGTNELHGSVFETFRNNYGGLRARSRSDVNIAPKYIRNEFGASAGGRIIKNKTFWFASYEGLRLHQANYAQGAVPTAAMWAGDFGNATTTSSQPIAIYNPFSTSADGTRSPYAGNLIPQNQISPLSKTMQKYTPLPAGTTASVNPWLGANFSAYYPAITTNNAITGKIDHVFSEKDNLSGRFSTSWQVYSLAGGLYGYPPPGVADATGTSYHNYRNYTSVVRWNHVFTPHFLNELQLSGSRSPIHFGTLSDSTNWGSALGLPNPFEATGWPTICATGNSPFLFSGCWDNDNRNQHNMTAFQIDENITWISGRHTMKFGYKGRQEYNNYGFWQQQQGSHSFGYDWTANWDPVNKTYAPFTGSGLASMVLGLPTSLSDQYNRGYYYFRQKEQGLYFQDSWKVTPRVTLNLGLRWDNWTPYSEKYDRLVNLNLNNLATVPMQVITPHNTAMEQMPGIPPSVLASWAARGLTWVTANSVGFPGALVPPVNRDFGPRVGIAYRITDKWVLRAGFGMYYWPLPLAQILASAGGNPPLNLRFSNAISNQNGLYPFYSLTNAPGANDFYNTAGVPVDGIVPIATTARSIMPWDPNNWRDDQARQWTFVIERELMKNTALKLSYVGIQGRNLEQRWLWNGAEAEYNYQLRTGLAANSGNPDPRRVNPNWTAGCCNGAMEHNGFSNSHTLSVQVERRFSSGLAFQWFYTFARALTTNDTGASWGSASINSSASGGDDQSSATASSYAVPENNVIRGEPNLTTDQRLRFGYANSDSVPTHHVRWNGIYDLPFGRGKKFGNGSSRAVNALIGGWQVAFIGEWRSGFWSSVTSSDYMFGDPTLSPDQRLTMNFAGATQLLWFRGDFDPRLATGVDQNALQSLVPVDRSQRVLRPVGSNFNNQIPMVLANGTVRNTSVTDMLSWNSRNFFKGPGFWNQDLSVFKNFAITERLRVRLTGDVFNLFNHPADVSPNATTGLVNLGLQTNAPRIVQFSLRLSW